jgi:hypothetical protein
MAASNLSDVIMRNTSGSRPEAGVPGRLYYETDTYKMYRDSGSTWEDVEGQGGTSASALDNIGDVSASSPNDGQVITWNSTSGSWTPYYPLPQIVSGSASAKDSHTSSGTWEDINSMSVNITPYMNNSKLLCTFTYTLYYDDTNWGHHATRFYLDDSIASESWVFSKDSAYDITIRHLLTTHAVFTGITSGSHNVKVQWNDNNSGANVSFYQRRLTVTAGQ